MGQNQGLEFTELMKKYNDLKTTNGDQKDAITRLNQELADLKAINQAQLTQLNDQNARNDSLQAKISDLTK